MRFPMQTTPETFFNIDEFVPSLRREFERTPLNPKRILLVALPVEKPEANGPLVPALHDRGLLSFSDGKEVWSWETDSLRALFRGDKQPPVLGDYPEAYDDCFMLMDLHVLEISKFFGDRRDAEMREIYSSLRRRPDGRSLGIVHDYMWQAAALILGTRPLSQAEFEAIMARVERSCRTFEQGPTSRNFVATLKATLGRSNGSKGNSRASPKAIPTRNISTSR
jgi:hypothetical protein